MNKTKSYVLDLGLDKTTSTQIQLQFPYAWAENSITYLGIQLTKSTKSLFSANYLLIRTKLQMDLTRMASFEFSWLGCLAAFKMFHLPQILYLFRTIPIPLPLSYFKTLQKILAKIIWQGKKSRCGHYQLIKNQL